MTTLSTFAIESWLMSVLNGTGALTGHVFAGGEIPPGTAYPAVVFDFVSNIDRVTSAGVSIYNDALYDVSVLGKGASIAALKTMADAVYGALQRASGSNNDGTVWTCTREEEINLPPDLVNGVQYRTLTQRFRIEAKAS